MSATPRVPVPEPSTSEGTEGDESSPEEAELEEGDEDLDEIYRATARKRKKQALQMAALAAGGLLVGAGTFAASGTLFEAQGLSEDAVWVIGYGALLFGIPTAIFAIALFVNATMLESRHQNEG